MPSLPPGSRVLVTWNDGQVYPATLCAFAQGLAQVRWDGSAASAWVPLASVRPLTGAAPAAAAPPSAPAPPTWNAYPAYSGARAAPAAAHPAPAHPHAVATPAPAHPHAVATPAPAPARASGARSVPPPSAPASGARSVPPPAALAAPPRPMRAFVGGLPRGLVYEPTGPGPGAGQAFFIFFGFVTSADGDAAMRMTDIEHLGDDVAALRAAGFRVVVDLQGDLAGLNAALAGTHPDAGGAPAAGVFWGSHGEEDGTIEDCQGFRIAPEQIAQDATRRGACKLFVMSACGTGQHGERWQKALGPQAAIIAWGAPITNDRAIDFLTPDDESSKDFDDLLERHLGVRRVAPDGPLVEARELARQHEDKLATLLLGFDELVEAAHKRLACPLQRGKRGEAYFTVRTPSSKERPDAPRAQTVRAAPVGMADSFLLVSSLVGPYSDALDLARGLRTVSPALHLRLAIARISPPEQDFVVVETLFRRRRLDPITLSRNISAVGAYADRLEDLFFGSDQR
ncbi:MAG TPA: hypothetical protein VFS43_40120 [Polyangiaceae bacterium]|nr:hypothetical protein [Polyangiaceae bacterium]